MKILRKLIVVILFFLGAICYAQESPEISVGERKALISLFLNMKGAGWTAPWDLRAPVHTWEGVHIKDGHVVALDLFGNNLGGAIPESIGKLKHLAILNLGVNEITGTLPESIGRLKKLRILDLSNNTIDGGIPTSVANLTQLEILELKNNNFKSIKGLEALDKNQFLVFNVDDPKADKKYKDIQFEKTRMADTKFEDDNEN